MKKKWKLACAAIGTWLLGSILAYGTPMELVYDGQRHLYDLPPITLYINQEEVPTMVMPPIQLDGSVLVPGREVFEPMGATVQWNSYEKKVYVDYKEILMVLEPNSSEVWLNGETIFLPAPVKFINDKLMLPVRFISEELGFKVDWIGTSRSVYISDLSPVLPDTNVPDISVPEEVLPETGGSGEEAEKEESLKNISYLGDGLLILEKTPGLRLQDVIDTDHYRERQIIVDLGADYSQTFGYGNYRIGDAFLQQVQVETNGTTKLILQETTIHSLKLEETDSGIFLQLVKPREVYEKIVVIDPGHGGNDGGAAANGWAEKDINFMHALAIYQLLETDPTIKVYMTRFDDVYVLRSERAKIANEIEAHLFVSMHNNSVTSTTVKGTETLYYPSTADTRSMEVARVIQNHLLANCDIVDRGIKPRPELEVLNSTHMPAVLVEVGFITNVEELEKITSDVFVRQLAKSIYDGIKEIFDTIPL